MNTFDNEEERLGEKGYLAENFKTGSQLGYWLKDFKDRFILSQQQAKLDGQAKNFQMETFGKFNEGLELVFFTLRYRYDPDQDSLTLKSLYARLGKHSKTYVVTNDNLKFASEVHETLTRPVVVDKYAPLYNQLQRDFERDRNPDNDYPGDQPEYPAKNHPEKLSETPDPAPLSIGNLPAALKRFLRK